MSEKNILSRIQHKHDIEANWIKAVNFIPKKAELIVYDPDENFDYSRAKIGDGIKNVNDLPFMIDKTEVALKTDILSPDLSQNDPEAADYVKGVIRQESLPEGYPYKTKTTTDLITWDGNTDGLVTIDVDGMLMYKISDNTLTKDELNGTIMRLSNGTDSIEMKTLTMSNGGVVVFADSNGKQGGYIVYSDNYDFYGLVFPEAGIYWFNTASDGYYLTAFSKVNTIITQLERKFIPDSIIYEQSDWEQYSSEEKGYIKNRPFYYTGGKINCSEERIHSSGSQVSPLGFQLKPNLRYTIKGEIYCYYQIGASGNGNRQNVNYAMSTDSNCVISEQQMIFYDQNVGFKLIMTIENGYIKFRYEYSGDGTVTYASVSLIDLEICNKKEIYEGVIPNTIARVKDIPVPVQPDWSQNDPTAADFIKNKPDEEDAFKLAIETELISPVATASGEILTDNNGIIITM